MITLSKLRKALKEIYPLIQGSQAYERNKIVSHILWREGIKKFDIVSGNVYHKKELIVAQHCRVEVWKRVVDYTLGNLYPKLDCKTPFVTKWKLQFEQVWYMPVMLEHSNVYTVMSSEAFKFLLRINGKTKSISGKGKTVTQQMETGKIKTSTRRGGWKVTKNFT